jgi:hypothetical protein
MSLPWEQLLLLYTHVIYLPVMYNVMAFVSLDSPSWEVPCLILLLVVYQDVTRQTKELYRLKHDGALKRGLAYLSQCNSSWFCHNYVTWVMVIHPLVVNSFNKILPRLKANAVESSNHRAS